MNQSSLVSPVHSVSHPTSPSRARAAPSFPSPGHHHVTFCSPVHLAYDKHGHSLRTSKSSAIWQLQDHEEPGERMLAGMMPGERFLSQELLAASCPAQLTRLEHL